MASSLTSWKAYQHFRQAEEAAGRPWADGLRAENLLLQSAVVDGGLDEPLPEKQIHPAPEISEPSSSRPRRSCRDHRATSPVLASHSPSPAEVDSRRRRSSGRLRSSSPPPAVIEPSVSRRRPASPTPAIGGPSSGKKLSRRRISGQPASETSSSHRDSSATAHAEPSSGRRSGRRRTVARARQGELRVCRFFWQETSCSQGELQVRPHCTFLRRRNSRRLPCILDY
jgi:hypothetical protein